MALSPGATAGPVDMSVTVQFYVTEAGLLALLLGTGAGGALQSRLLAAETQCESQGAPTFQMTLSPLEQGLLMGALADVSCQFSGGLRVRVQGAITQKLVSLGAPASL